MAYEMMFQLRPAGQDAMEPSRGTADTLEELIEWGRAQCAQYDVPEDLVDEQFFNDWAPFEWEGTPYELRLVVRVERDGMWHYYPERSIRPASSSIQGAPPKKSWFRSLFGN